MWKVQPHSHGHTERAGSATPPALEFWQITYLERSLFDLAGQPIGAQFFAQISCAGRIACDRLQAVDSANVSLSFDDAIFEARERVSLANEGIPALFRASLVRIGTNLHRDTAAAWCSSLCGGYRLRSIRICCIRLRNIDL